jgi:hypothetical protein
MNYVTSIISNILPKEVPKYLGRWRIEYCKVKINNIVEMANVDHCGSCGQYALDKLNSRNKYIEIKDIPSKIMT